MKYVGRRITLHSHLIRSTLVETFSVSVILVKTLNIREEEFTIELKGSVRQQITASSIMMNVMSMKSLLPLQREWFTSAATWQWNWCDRMPQQSRTGQQGSQLSPTHGHSIPSHIFSLLLMPFLWCWEENPSSEVSEENISCESYSVAAPISLMWHCTGCSLRSDGFCTTLLFSKKVILKIGLQNLYTRLLCSNL